MFRHIQLRNDVEGSLEMSTIAEKLKLRRLRVNQGQYRLDSWKEIAVYLGRDIRTVQRWEQSEGLPVRRVFHKKASSVYALANELDAWLSNRSPVTLNATRNKGNNNRSHALSQNWKLLGMPKSFRGQGNGFELLTNSAIYSGLVSILRSKRSRVFSRSKAAGITDGQPVVMSFFVACQLFEGQPDSAQIREWFQSLCDASGTDSCQSELTREEMPVEEGHGRRPN